MFVAEVDADVAVAFDAHRAVDAHGAVVGGDDDVDVALGEGFEDFEQGRVFEPREGERAVGFFVLGQFAHDVAIGAGVGEHVDEVVDDYVEPRAHELGEAVDQLFAVLGVEHFVVGVFDVEAVATEVLAEEFALVLVFPAFFILVDPVLGIFALDFGGHQACKHGVAGKLCGGGQDGEVDVVAIGAEVLFEGGLYEFPLVVAEVVYHDEEGGALFFE